MLPKVSGTKYYGAIFSRLYERMCIEYPKYHRVITHHPFFTIFLQNFPELPKCPEEISAKLQK